MTNALAAALVATLTFLAALLIASLAMRGALIFGDSVALWAGAISAADGEVSVGGMVAAYPTIPFLALTLV